MNLPFDELKEGLDYDLWALNLWMETLERKGMQEPDWSILRHVLAAQEIWLIRFKGVSPQAMPEPIVSPGKLRELHDGWLDNLHANLDDPIIEYRNTSGVPSRRRLSRIVRHVVDHGTYHRGELRGLCLARNDEDFPETGFIGYYIAMKLPE